MKTNLKINRKVSSMSERQPIQEKPKQATEDYVLNNLLRPHLTEEAPDELAKAIFSLMCKYELFEVADGHVEIPGSRGATLKFPTEACRAVRTQLLLLLDRDPRLEFISHFIRGDGISGTAALGSGRHGPMLSPADQRAREQAREQARLVEELKRVTWDKETYIDAFGADAREEGQLLVENYISYLQSRSKPSTTATDTSFDGEQAPEAHPEYEFRMVGDHWSITFDGVHRTLKHRQGLSFLHRLLSAPHTEIDVTDLDDAAVVPTTQPEELMDAQTLADAHREAVQLEAALATAKMNEDAVEQRRLQAEIDNLTGCTSSATGRLGESRRIRDERERSRDRVKRSLKTALEAIKEQLPALHQHLVETLKTPYGMKPCYRPTTDLPWVLG